MEQGDLVWTLIGNREEVYGPITHLVPAADGKSVTTVANGQMATWDLRKLKLLRRLGAVGVTAVANSTDGRLLAEYSQKAGHVSIWDITTGKVVRTVATEAAKIQALAFSADGRTLAGAHEYTLRFWDLDTGQEKQAINLKDQWMKALTFSPDGTLMAAARGNGTVSLFDTRTGEIRKDLKSPLPYTDIKQLAFSPDGKQVVASNHNRSGPAVLWNVETGASQELLPASIQGIKAVAFSPNGKTVLGGTGDGLIRIWSSTSGKLLVTLAQVPADEIRDIMDGRWMDVVPNSWVAYTPDGYYNAAPGAGRYIRWDVGDEVFPASKYAAIYHRPDKVHAALNDQK